jgi:hypothetical protein
MMTGSGIGAIGNLYQTYALLLFLAFSLPMIMVLIRKAITMYR